MMEEAKALLHSFKTTNKHLKTLLTLFILFIVSCIQYRCQNVVIDRLSGAYFFFGILCNNLLVPIICLGLYSDVTDQVVQLLGAMPFLMMIFFSTTFSPGGWHQWAEGIVVSVLSVSMHL